MNRSQRQIHWAFNPPGGRFIFLGETTKNGSRCNRGVGMSELTVLFHAVINLACHSYSTAHIVLYGLPGAAGRIPYNHLNLKGIAIRSPQG